MASIALLPFSWAVAPERGVPATCPSPKTILGTFAAITVTVSLLGLLVGHRTFVRTISCHLFGNPGSRAYLYTWVFSLGIHLAANALVAIVIKHTTGYGSSFSIWQLMLFYTARPRISPAILLYASIGAEDTWKSPLAGFDVEHLRNQLGRPPVSDDGLLELRALGNTVTTGRVNVVEAEQLLRKHKYAMYPAGWHNPWISAAISGLVTELILLALSMFVYGAAVHFAASHGLYHPCTFFSMQQSGRVMYVGALVYLVYASLGLCCISILCYYTLVRESYEHKEDDLRYVFPRIAAAGLVVGTIVGSWLFWAGFVHYAGDM
jgi:hypothetical protein